VYIVLLEVREQKLLQNLIAMIVDKAAAGTGTALSSSSSSAANPMSSVAFASVIAGSIVFLVLIALVTHASYMRRKEHNWKVAVWNMNESAAARMHPKEEEERGQQQQQQQVRDK
jgi:hypothetical protein